MGNTDCSNFSKNPTRLAVVKTDPPNFHWAAVKTDFPNFTNLLRAGRRSKQTLQTSVSLTTHFAGVKTDCPHFYKPPRRLVVVKTDSTSFYKSNYTLGSGQNSLSVPPSLLQTWWWSKRALLPSTSLLHHAWRRTKRALQTSTSRKAMVKRLSKLLQASYALSGGQNGLSELPAAF